MPTISMTNCNDLPSSGPLTAADLDRDAGNHHPPSAAPRIPRERDIGPAHAVMAGVLLLVLLAICAAGLRWLMRMAFA